MEDDKFVYCDECGGECDGVHSRVQETPQEQAEFTARVVLSHGEAHARAVLAILQQQLSILYEMK
jgi:hypothetical protein